MTSVLEVSSNKRTSSAYTLLLVGIPGVARDDQWRNLIASYFYYITKNNLWKCATVKYAPCYLRKAPVLTQNAHTSKKNTSFLSLIRFPFLRTRIPFTSPRFLCITRSARHFEHERATVVSYNVMSVTSKQHVLQSRI
jgi:hypothetical protein